MTNELEPPHCPDRTVRLVVLGVLIVGAIVPIVLYWAVFGLAATVEPGEALEMLRGESSAAVLVDVRPAGDFREQHVDGARSWPVANILAADDPDDVPPEFRGKTLLMLCDAGYTSRGAADHVNTTGIGEARSVRGGIQEWIGAAGAGGDRPFGRWADASGQASPLPFHESPWQEQLAAVASGFGMKGTYTALSLVLIVVLWRRREPDLAALRRAMAAFFIGENCCAINYFVFADTSYTFEFLHSYGMLACFGLATYALVHGLDSRILMLSDPDRRCAAISLCGRCAKHADAPCGLKRTFYLIIPACMVLALMPLAAEVRLDSYNTVIYGTPYNYTHRLGYQLFETRYCPAAAVLLLAASLLVLIFQRSASLEMPKVLFALGMGPLGFALLRMMLLGSYAHNQVWFTFWEEGTELLFVASVCFVLWVFRHGLFQQKGEPA